MKRMFLLTIVLFAISASSAMAAPTQVFGQDICICPCPPAAADYRPDVDPNPFTLYVGYRPFSEELNYMSLEGWVRWNYYQAFGVMLTHSGVVKFVAMSKRQAAAGQSPQGYKPN